MPKKSDKPRDPTQTVAIQVRMKEGLRAQIESVALDAGRPMNAEITERLHESFRLDEAFNGPKTRQVLLLIAQDLAEIERLAGASWTDDPATFHAASLVLQDTIARQRPKPPNYDEAMEFTREQNATFAWRDKTVEVLMACGAMVERQPNALASFLDGGPTQPYKEVVADEEKWFHPTHPDEPLSEADRAWVRDRLAEVRDIEAGANGAAEKVQALLAPIKEAKAKGRELYEEYNSNVEDRLAAMMEDANAS